MWWQLILTGLMLGVGLAMDAFAVSMTNGLNEPQMRRTKATLIALTFALFQTAMPLIGWLCVTLIAERFEAFARWVPYIALVLLLIIGGKMLFEGIKSVRKQQRLEVVDESKEAANASAKPLTLAVLLTQAVATGIIGVVTFAISLAGVFIGRKFGDKLGVKAQIVGGVVLIAIGIEIFVTGVFF